jgi:molecular chaperone HscA
LRDAEIKPAELDGVILVGGSTRVRAVRSYVQKIFGHEPLADIDPDQVVALGAAVQAHQLAGQGDKQDILLLDVLPLSLGIEVGGGVVDKILPRNTTIPAAAKGTYTTQKDLQTGFEIHVVQGERELSQDCRSLAKFTLRGIPPLPAGMARLEVRFSVDENGILSVDAKETVTGIAQRVEVKPAYGLDDETVERMLLEAIDHGEEDLAARKLQENRIEGERVLLATETSLLAAPELVTQAEREAISLAMKALATAIAGTDASRIQLRIEDLDHATKEFAERRMNLAISKAIEGKNLGEVEQSVRHAKGIEAAHEP